MGARGPATAGCALCGRKPVEQNHVGGRNHVAWFTMPFCREHHDQFHELLRNAGVDLHYTPDPVERIARANQAISVCQWMLAEALQRANKREITNAEGAGNNKDV